MSADSPLTIEFNRTYLKIAKPANLIFNLQPFFVFTHFLILPRHPLHMPSLLPPHSLPFYAALFVYLPVILYSLLHFAQLMKTGFHFFTGLFLLILSLLRRELRVTQGRLSSTKIIEHPADIAIVYRSLQLIMKDISAIFGNYLPLVQGIMGQMAILAGYVAIGGNGNLASVVPLLAIPFFVLTWAVMLFRAGNVNSKSKSCCQSWKRGEIEKEWSRGEVRYMSKFRRSCKPIDFHCQGMMTITKKTVIKFVQGIVRGTLRMLLALEIK